jgi:hypothetical protein
MRKKVVIRCGSVLAAIASIALAVLLMLQSQPKLAVGMTDEEVETVLGDYEYSVGGPIYLGHGPYNPEPYWKYYPQGPDWMGNAYAVKVYFDYHQPEHVISWEFEPKQRVRPPWIGNMLKSVGW